LRIYFFNIIINTRRAGRHNPAQLNKWRKQMNKNNVITLNIEFCCKNKKDTKAEFNKILNSLLDIKHIYSVSGEYNIFGKKEMIDIL